MSTLEIAVPNYYKETITLANDQQLHNSEMGDPSHAGDLASSQSQEVPSETEGRPRPVALVDFDASRLGLRTSGIFEPIPDRPGLVGVAIRHNATAEDAQSQRGFGPRTVTGARVPASTPFGLHLAALSFTAHCCAGEGPLADASRVACRGFLASASSQQAILAEVSAATPQHRPCTSLGSYAPIIKIETDKLVKNS